MPTDHRKALANIKRLDQLVVYLRDELDWPIARDSFEEIDDLFFDFSPAELGIDRANAAKIEEIKRLRPLSAQQPWGIFFVKFEPKRLPVVALRRNLGQVALKKRSSANRADRQAWSPNDLLFISNYGEGNERQIALAHFSAPDGSSDLPALKVLGWNNQDTALRLDDVAAQLTGKLSWPDDESDAEAWRNQWRSAFTLGHREVIHTAQELSLKLAELARNIRDSIKGALLIENDKGPLRGLMRSFQESLVHDLDEDGFADTYAQTIAYGLLSARMVDPSKKTADDLVTNLHTSPFLKEMLETFLRLGGRKGKAGQPGIDFDELGVRDVIELLDRSNMEAVLKDFGDRNQNEDPVMHFFEGFLQAYDKKIRKDRGVFYTPQPVVSYIVRSVHELLQTEFALADGLADTTTWGEMLKKHPGLKLPPLTDEPGEKHTISADEPFVQILDPATGTATFLVEVIEVIHKHLKTLWKTGGAAAMPTIQNPKSNIQNWSDYWNDYVPKSLLPRLHAFELMMAPYAIAHMKVGLKLAETGYRFGTEERARIYLTNALEPWQKQLPLIGFDALAHEAAAVNEIKRHKRFTVVIGNPPYSGISSNMSEYAQHIVDAYKFVDGAALNEKKLWLQDDYVKFIRKAQTIIDSTRVGVFGYITNHGFLDNPTFRGMRQSLMETFPRLCVLDLHGNANKKEQSPDGSVDKPVFDIKQGVAICLATRGGGKPSVAHSEIWGTRESKYQWLDAHSASQTMFGTLAPDSPYYFFKPHGIESRAEYDEGWRIPDIFPLNTVGFVTARDALTIQDSEDEIWEVVQRFVSLSEERARTEFELGKDARDWRVLTAQNDIRKSGPTKKLVHRILYRPFDFRFTYYTGNSRGFYASPCSNVMKHMIAGKNLALCFNRREELAVNYSHFLATRLMTEHGLLSSKTTDSQAPLYLLAKDEDDAHLFAGSGARPNLGSPFLTALAKNLNLRQSGDFGLPSGLTPEDIFHYAYAVFHSPGYRSRYAEFLKIDFPRLPLTGNLELFRALARLGGELTALHLLESPKLAQPITEFIGKSKEVTKVGYTDQTVWINAGGTKAKTTAGTSGFQGVPEAVWNVHIGGYQVCEKWLKDRKGRTLTKDDIAHYQKIVVALSETIRLMAEIDKVIETHGGWPGAFTNEKKTKS
jgi:predicted helicase